MKNRPFIQLRSIQKQFPGVLALEDVFIDIYPGEVHALVGENGAGKSTLIKILAGVYRPDSGSYILDGNPISFSKPIDAIDKGLSVIYQELNLINDLSVAENLFLGNLPKNKWGIIDYKRLEKESHLVLKKVGLQINPFVKIGHLPVAMQQLCEIAKALTTNSKVVIMDEPTSALSHGEIEKLFAVIKDLKKEGVCIVYVSHKMDEVFHLSDRITVLRDGCHIISDHASEFTEKSLISKMVGRNVDTMFMRKKHKPGGVVLDVKNLNSNVVKDINLKIHKGEVVGLAGLMGAGRTEIARALFGVDEVHSGTIKIENRVVKNINSSHSVKNGIGMVPEDRKESGILPNLDIMNNMSISCLNQFRKFFYLKSITEKQIVKEMIKKMRVKTPGMYQQILNLSGGNQQKVILSRWLMKQDLKILIIDEPTRGIDIGSKEEIYKLIEELAQGGLSILLISSELPEIISLCDRVYIIKDGRISNELAAEDLTQEKALSFAL